MGEEREKTNPDYPVTPAWRPASHPGVRLPAPSLEPARPSSQAGVDLNPPPRQPSAIAAPVGEQPIPPGTPHYHAPIPGQTSRPVSSEMGRLLQQMRPATPVAPTAGQRSQSQAGYSVVPASQESIRPVAPAPRPASTSVMVPLTPAGAAQVAAVRQPSQAVQPASQPAVPIWQQPLPAGQVPISQQKYRPASDGFRHPAAGGHGPASPPMGLRPTSGFGLGVQDPPGTGAAASRRAQDPTRLLPWLRDKNKRFKALTDAETGAMFAFASLQRVSLNTVLQEFDAPPTACFCVTEGAIVVRVRRPNGSIRELDRFGPGELCGILALVDAQPSPYEIVAASNAEVVAFEADKLAQFVAAYDPTALAAVAAWMPIIAEHFRAIQQRVAKLSSTKRAKIQARDDDAWAGVK